MKTIQSLQVMRGIAALAVVFYHVYVIFQMREYGGNFVFESAAKHGFVGVNFFFVLSGFIILMAHRKDLGRPEALLGYLRKRFVRVYPVYWVYLSGFLLAAVMGLGYPDFSWRPLYLFSSYSLFEFDESAIPPLKVAWTLFYEIRFYALFAIVIYSLRFGISAFIIWTIGILGGVLFDYSGPMNLFSIWNVYFVLGMLGYLAFDKYECRFGAAALLIGIFGLFIYFVNSDISRVADLATTHKTTNFLLGFSFLCVVFGAVVLENRHKIKMPAVFMLVGDASYSIYLVHSAAISFVCIIGSKLGVFRFVSVEFYFVFAFFSSVVCGILAFVIIEKPLLTLVRNRLG